MRQAVQVLTTLLSVLGTGQWVAAQEQHPPAFEYLVLATNQTSTMQDEMQEAADAGYAFVGVMGGDTSFGGSEVVVVMQRLANSTTRLEYRLLATNKTSTMQDELQRASDAGFSYRGQTVFSTTFGGEEAVVILERDRDRVGPNAAEYRLLATTRTSTMQRDIVKCCGSASGVIKRLPPDPPRYFVPVAPHR